MLFPIHRWRLPAPLIRKLLSDWTSARACVPCFMNDVVYCIERTGTTTIVPDAVRAFPHPSITGIARIVICENSNLRRARLL